MHIKRYAAALTLSAALLLGALSTPAHAEEAEGFTPIRTYTEQFADVSGSAWYYDAVKALYELGLTNGKGQADRFDPDGDLTVAEVVTMAARLRSLYETGDSEAGPAAQDSSGAWYLPYTAYLQEQGALGQELEGAYDRPATRAEMAHVLAAALPQSFLEPVNRAVVSEGHASGQYIQDVTGDTPYQADILLLYEWGVAGGADQTGSFLPGEKISRCEAAAMVTRLAYSELRLALDWVVVPAYSRQGVTMADLVKSDGTFYAAPEPDNLAQIDADVRYMLSRGERELSLEYPADTLTHRMVDQLMSAFLEDVRQYTEQTYNYISISFSLRTGFIQLSFSSSFYGDELVEQYREETMDYAIAVHDAMWESGKITEDMSEYDKAKVYFEWICDNCRYDHTYADMSHTGYRLFHEGIAVCDGYTAAYNLLLKLEDISCGTSSTADHIWTVAELDGTSCHIDTTWGDQSYGVEYDYFAMTEKEAFARF